MDTVGSTARSLALHAHMSFQEGAPFGRPSSLFSGRPSIHFELAGVVRLSGTAQKTLHDVCVPLPGSASTNRMCESFSMRKKEAVDILHRFLPSLSQDLSDQIGQNPKRLFVFMRSPFITSRRLAGRGGFGPVPVYRQIGVV